MKRGINTTKKKKNKSRKDEERERERGKHSYMYLFLQHKIKQSFKHIFKLQMNLLLIFLSNE